MTVSQYAQAVNAGGPTYYGSGGFYWWVDAAYTAGSWGYTNAVATTEATKRAIAGTADVALYQSQRIDPVEYRFDGLVAGTYQVTVGFAEFRKVKRGACVFDAVAEGRPSSRRTT